MIHAAQNNALPLGKLADASGRGLLNHTSYTGMSTTRQKKHEMLLTFMANAKKPQHVRRTAPVKPKLLSTLLSFFF